MKNYILIFTFFLLNLWASEFEVQGPVRILIERDAPGGLEQASIIFEKSHVVVYSNSNFETKQNGESFLGHFKLPYDEKLSALKLMLEDDFQQLGKEKRVFAELGVSEGSSVPHKLNVFLNQTQIIANDELAQQWENRLRVVLSSIEQKHAVKAAVVKKDRGKWTALSLPGQRPIDVKECTRSYCLIEGFGKVVP